MKTIFVISQTEQKNWQVDQRDGENTIRTSYHSSKRKAVTAVADRMAGVTQFAVVIPDKEERGND